MRQTIGISGAGAGIPDAVQIELDGCHLVRREGGQLPLLLFGGQGGQVLQILVGGEGGRAQAIRRVSADIELEN